MMKDPIVDEIRRVRQNEASKHGYDVKAIVAAAKKRQRRSTHKVVSFVRKRSVTEPRPSGSATTAVQKSGDAGYASFGTTNGARYCRVNIAVASLSPVHV